LADNSEYSSSEFFSALSITSLLNGNSFAPPVATRRFSAAGLRASYLATMSTPACAHAFSTIALYSGVSASQAFVLT
jgi:hypothetical protein